MTPEADLQRLYTHTQGLEMADGWWHRTVNELECHRTIYLKIAKMANLYYVYLLPLLKQLSFILLLMCLAIGCLLVSIQN